MGSKGKRAKKQRTSSTAGGRTGRAAQRRESATQRLTLVIGGLAIGLVVLVAIVFFVGVVSQTEASDFEVTVYQGQEELGGDDVNFNDVLTAGKPVILNFWGGDCPPCRAEMPDLQQFYDEHQAAVTLLGLDVGKYRGLGTKQSALSLLEELEITYPAGTPPNSKPLSAYDVSGLPSTVFFDSNGQVFRQWDGLINARQLEDVISGLLDES
ncbi:MAG: TlpA disulfide reductase family protein [Chloroflexi bacterium]|nr:TlpA disulfide reductase family protein [Chloroflexota bacterium]